MIGGLEDIKYTEYEIRMEPGDKPFLSADGVPDATDADQKMFGSKRMPSALSRSPDAPIERILGNVREDIDTFVNDAEQFETSPCSASNTGGVSLRMRTGRSRSDRKGRRSPRRQERRGIQQNTAGGRGAERALPACRLVWTRTMSHT